MVGEERVVVVDNNELEWKKRKEESSKVLMVARQNVLNKFGCYLVYEIVGC